MLMHMHWCFGGNTALRWCADADTYMVHWCWYIYIYIYVYMICRNWKTNMEGKGLAQNQCPDIWAGARCRCASEVRQRPLWRVSKGRRHKLLSLWWLFHWVHAQCSCIPGTLKPHASLRCTRYRGQARPGYGRPTTEVTVGGEPGGGVIILLPRELLIPGRRWWARFHHTRCRVACGKFNELLPVITSRSIPIISRGSVYNLCVRSALLHASKTCLQHSDRAWRSGEDTPLPPTQMARPCRT